MKKLIAVALLCLVMLAACGGPFRSKTAWKSAQQQNPLEIPPGLDAPSTSGDVVAPAAGDENQPEPAEQNQPGLPQPPAQPPQPGEPGQPGEPAQPAQDGIGSPAGGSMPDPLGGGMPISPTPQPSYNK